ncbi:MAG: MFS transporter, partial [Proteobacteria bacterium]|nr:MFS transporter [Pseudomonadota bacterium]
MHTSEQSPANLILPTDPKTARIRLIGMGCAYAMGTFNDNFFKQVALLLAVDAGLHAIQGGATLLFALPFVLFSAWAGWLADRLPKKDIVVGAKFLELAAMLLGLWALLSLNWVGIVAIVFLMGLQSTLFSPALNGAIPENFPASEVPRVNGLLKLVTTVTILLGIGLGGVVMDLPVPGFARAFSPEGAYGFGRLAVGLIAALVAVLGLVAAFAIHRSSPLSHGSNPFPWQGPVDSVRHARECHAKDQALFLTLAGEAFFYGFSSFVILVINNLGAKQMGFSLTLTSLLSVALMVGICIGSLLAGRHQADIWRRLMIPAGIGMAVSLLIASLAPFLPGTVLGFIFLMLTFTATGICGGLYLIPLVSFIQIRPKATEKGKILGISNFASFTGIIVSGLLFMVVGDLPPTLLLTASALVALTFMGWAMFFLRRQPVRCLADKTGGPLALLLQLLLSLRYRVKVVGLTDIPVDDRGNEAILFMPNHPALIDPSIVYSLLAGFRPRPLVDQRQMQGLFGTLAAKLTGAVLIPDPSKDGVKARQGVEDGLRAVTQALRGGEHVLFYPSGKVYRSAEEKLGPNSGAADIIAAMPGLRVVLIRTTGLWGSSFSYAGQRGAPNFIKVLCQGILTVAANLVFFTPRRQVQVEFVEDPDLPRDGNKKRLNPWLEQFYNGAKQAPMAVPRFFWQGGQPTELPEYTQDNVKREAGETISVTPELREAVYASLRQAADLAPDHVLTENMSLAGDLGLDSLALMDLALTLETEHGRTISELAALVSVGDCLAAAAGTAGQGTQNKPAPAAWFTPGPAKNQKLRLADGVTRIPDAFMALMRQAPNQALVADRSSLRTRREIVTAALVLAERFKALPGKRLGIMLPSVPTVVPVWLAAQLAGKEPVFFNWTVGEANLRHCLGTAGLSHIISAQALLDRLEHGGLSLSALPVTWLRLETLAASLGRWEKLKGLVRAHLLRSSSAYPMADVAAVLFTSGSESLPKAVPLTHVNLLTNAKDIIDVLRVEADETILAMLPPFHSFGLMVGLVLPLSLGLKAVFHANPTEPQALISLVRDYKLTLLAAPPTFLEAMLDKAKTLDKSQETGGLASLRFAFAGAEKCPEHVYRAFAEACPKATLCEGYGITECSPVVAVNRPEAVVPGSIGHLLPSVTAALVREEDGQIVDLAEAGQTGMLLVRGPSIFGGYLGDAPDPFVSFAGHSWYRTGDLV